MNRIRIAHLPTRIESMPRLSKVLGGPQLFVKRDDQTGLAFGGNKIRKLEFLLAEAQSNGAKTLITTGAVQSNHCRQTAAVAARFGYECILVLTGKRPEQLNGNLLLDHLFGAKIIWVKDREQRDTILNDTFEHATGEGKRPYLVPYGASNPIGVLGYTYAIEEFVDQGLDANWLVVASSSGGTQAGMELGKHIFGYKGNILGISVDEGQSVLQQRVAKLASSASEIIGQPTSFAPSDIMVNADYCKAGYGIMTESEREAIGLFAKYEGLLIDPVYTGRAAGALIDLIRLGHFNKDDVVLFWHTGGLPALFAENYQSLIIRE